MDISVLKGLFEVPCTSVQSAVVLRTISPLTLFAVADPGGRGGMAPRWRPEIFFRQYINIITKPTAYDGPWEY